MIATASSFLALIATVSVNPVGIPTTAPQDPPEGVTITGLPSTVRLQEVVRATLRVESRRQSERPIIPEVDGLQILLGTPTRRQSMSSINGRQTISVSLDYPLELRTRRVGKFTIPSIKVKIGDKFFTTRRRVIEVVKDITGKNFGDLKVTPSRVRAYVHEPIRFDVECSIDSQLELAIGSSTQGVRFHAVYVEADWLSKMDGAEFQSGLDVDTDDPEYIVLNNSLQPADVSRNRDGKAYRMFRYHKTVLPTTPGKKTLAAPAMRFTVLSGVRRDRFSVFATRAQKDYMVYGTALELEILPLPVAGRPNPFYGGVGRFTIGARLDKTSVKVGGSVKLILTISGEGNTQYLQVPELDDIAGFHRLGKIENRTADKVEITYDLTPKTGTVTQLPAIAWNYFDTTPGVEKYVSVQTDPLAIDVRALTGEESLPSLPGAKPSAVEPGVDDIFDVKLGADREPAVLAGSPGRALALVAAFLPWLLAGFGLFFVRARKRSLADVAGRRARGAWRRFQKALNDGNEPLDGLVDYLADRLGCEPAAVIGPDLEDRLVAAGIDAAQAKQVRELVDAGIAARYGGGGGADKPSVMAVVQSLERTSVTGALGLVLACLLLGAAASPAQRQTTPAQQQLSAPEQAYRDRDYVAAAAGFRAALAAGDRRAAYNLGNSLFRQGRYAEALVAYEKARLALPRDEELLANIRLVRERLDLGTAEGEAFVQTLANMRDSFTARERFWLCVLCNALAAGLLFFGGRRLRILGIVAAVPALLLVVEIGFLAPNRPPKGIVISPQAALRSEPSADLAPLMTIRAGVAVDVLGSSSGWTVVRARGRKGWLPADAVAKIE